MGRARPAALLALLLALAVASPGCGRPSSGASSESPEEVATGGARKRELPRVRTAEVVGREMVHLLETTSVLESENEIQLLPRAPGIVIEVLAEEGDRVDEGDVLARLDDRDLVLAVEDAEVVVKEAENALDQAKLSIEEASARVKSANLAAEQADRDHQRNVRLFEGETVSALSKKALEDSLLARDNALAEQEQTEIALRQRQLEVTAAENALGRNRVALERARLNLSHMRIVAPISGVVAERNVRVGDAVNTGAKAFVLTDADHLRTVFLRPQEELGLFTRASGGDGSLTFTATAEAYPGREFQGQVQRISPTIQPNSGQFRVTARIEAPPESEGLTLLPGMLLRMQIVTERHPDALVVPKRALRREGEARYVLVVEPGGTEDDAAAAPEVAEAGAELAEDVAPAEGLPEGTAVAAAQEDPRPERAETRLRRVEVAEGFSDDENVEVIPLDETRLAAGDLVVEVGSRDLAEGDTVQIEDDTGSPPAEPGSAADPTVASSGDVESTDGE